MTDPLRQRRSKALVLTIDDDPDLAAIIDLHLRRWGHASRLVGSAEELWDYLAHQTPDAMLMDVMLGDADGSRLIAEVKARLPEVPVIMITRSASIDDAVRCMQHGAYDFITKPLDFGRLQNAIREALDIARVARRAEARPAARRGDTHGLVGRSAAMQELFQRIENVADADVSVLILGETGTGKELVARAVHRQSRRRKEPFVAVNAAAIPHELIESQLFGHERGAFTGAEQAHLGFCEQAAGGTLFLDEIGEMGFDVQVKLLRFLQDHVVQRVGSRKTRKVDVRVIAATNVDPREQIARRKLREDLYYRLRVVSLNLPPLRRRGDDVILLAEHFLARGAQRHGRELRRLTGEAAKALSTYSWPGNVRELENVIEEAVVLHRGRELTGAMLPPEILRGPEASAGTAGRQALRTAADPAPEPRLSARQTAEKRAVEEALERTGGWVEAAARELGISRATIYRRIKKYGLGSVSFLT